MQFPLFMLSLMMFATLLILYWHSMTHPHDVAPATQPIRKPAAPHPRG
ncbi:MAG: hypothetical protein NTV22_00625 [bacterium]|nr:hypothetical protein [bacterium]